jgi:hypothetical protein
MSKRFGRNQKRKLKSEISALHGLLDVLQRNLRAARYDAVVNESKIVTKYCLDSGAVRRMLDEVKRGLVQRYPDHLKPHVDDFIEKLFTVTEVTLSPDPYAYDATGDVCITGKVEALHYSMRAKQIQIQHSRT